MLKKQKLRPGWKMDKVVWVTSDHISIKLHTVNLPPDHPMAGEWSFELPFKDIAHAMEGPWTDWEELQKKGKVGKEKRR